MCILVDLFCQTVWISSLIYKENVLNINNLFNIIYIGLLKTKNVEELKSIQGKLTEYLTQEFEN